MNEDDGFTIQCDRCLVWQHCACMGMTSPSMVPDDYLCEQCDPDPERRVDAAYARAIQTRKRDDERRRSALYQAAITQHSARQRLRQSQSQDGNRSPGWAPSPTGVSAESESPGPRSPFRRAEGPTTLSASGNASTGPSSSFGPPAGGRSASSGNAGGAFAPSSAPQPRRPTRRRDDDARSSADSSSVLPEAWKVEFTPLARNMLLDPSLKHQLEHAMLPYQRWSATPGAAGTERPLRAVHHQGGKWVAPVYKPRSSTPSASAQALSAQRLATTQLTLSQTADQGTDPDESRRSRTFGGIPRATSAASPEPDGLCAIGGECIPVSISSASPLAKLSMRTYVKPIADTASAAMFKDVLTPHVEPTDPQPPWAASRTFSRPIMHGLFANQHIPAGCFIMEVKGILQRASDYRSDPKNMYPKIGCTKPRAHLLPPPLDLAIDMRNYGNSARFARFSCHPNAVLRPILYRRLLTADTPATKPTSASNMTLSVFPADKMEHHTSPWPADGVVADPSSAFGSNTTPASPTTPAPTMSAEPSTDEPVSSEALIEPELLFGLFALTDISKAHEITLGWEWDDAHIAHLLPCLVDNPLLPDSVLISHPPHHSLMPGTEPTRLSPAERLASLKVLAARGDFPYEGTALSRKMNAASRDLMGTTLCACIGPGTLNGSNASGGSVGGAAGNAAHLVARRQDCAVAQMLRLGQGLPLLDAAAASSLSQSQQPSNNLAAAGPADQAGNTGGGDTGNGSAPSTGGERRRRPKHPDFRPLLGNRRGWFDHRLPANSNQPVPLSTPPALSGRTRQLEREILATRPLPRADSQSRSRENSPVSQDGSETDPLSGFSGGEEEDQELRSEEHKSRQKVLEQQSLDAKNPGQTISEQPGSKALQESGHQHVREPAQENRILVGPKEDERVPSSPDPLRLAHAADPPSSPGSHTTVAVLPLKKRVQGTRIKAALSSSESDADPADTAAHQQHLATREASIAKASALSARTRGQRKAKRTELSLPNMFDFGEAEAAAGLEAGTTARAEGEIRPANKPRRTASGRRLRALSDSDEEEEELAGYEQRYHHHARHDADDPEEEGVSIRRRRRTDEPPSHTRKVSSALRMRRMLQKLAGSEDEASSSASDEEDDWQDKTDHFGEADEEEATEEEEGEEEPLEGDEEWASSTSRATAHAATSRSARSTHLPGENGAEWGRSKCSKSQLSPNLPRPLRRRKKDLTEAEIEERREKERARDRKRKREARERARSLKLLAQQQQPETQQLESRRSRSISPRTCLADGNDGGESKEISQTSPTFSRDTSRSKAFKTDKSERSDKVREADNLMLDDELEEGPAPRGHKRARSSTSHLVAGQKRSRILDFSDEEEEQKPTWASGAPETPFGKDAQPAPDVPPPFPTFAADSSPTAFPVASSADAGGAGGPSDLHVGDNSSAAISSPATSNQTIPAPQPSAASQTESQQQALDAPVPPDSAPPEPAPEPQRTKLSLSAYRQRLAQKRAAAESGAVSSAPVPEAGPPPPPKLQVSTSNDGTEMEAKFDVGTTSNPSLTSQKAYVTAAPSPGVGHGSESAGHEDSATLSTAHRAENTPAGIEHEREGGTPVNSPKPKRSPLLGLPSFTMRRRPVSPPAAQKPAAATSDPLIEPSGLSSSRATVRAPAPSVPASPALSANATPGPGITSTSAQANPAPLPSFRSLPPRIPAYQGVESKPPQHPTLNSPAAGPGPPPALGRGISVPGPGGQPALSPGLGGPPAASISSSPTIPVLSSAPAVAHTPNPPPDAPTGPRWRPNSGGPGTPVDLPRGPRALMSGEGSEPSSLSGSPLGTPGGGAPGPPPAFPPMGVRMPHPHFARNRDDRMFRDMRDPKDPRSFREREDRERHVGLAAAAEARRLQREQSPSLTAARVPPHVGPPPYPPPHGPALGSVPYPPAYPPLHWGPAAPPHNRRDARDPRDLRDPRDPRDVMRDHPRDSRDAMRDPRDLSPAAFPPRPARPWGGRARVRGGPPLPGGAPRRASRW